MDRNAFILFSAASVLLLAVAGAQIAEAGSSDAVGKIDADLAEMLGGAGEERIPVIVMLKGTEALDIDGFDVKYSYQLIPGLAGEASSTTIREMAESDRVSAIYFDDPAKISAPVEDIASAPDNALVYDNSSVDGQDNDSDGPLLQYSDHQPLHDTR